MAGEVYHIPALLEPTLELLLWDAQGTYLDATFGGGGHSRAMLERLGPQARVLAFDQDKQAQANVTGDPRLRFIQANFRHTSNYLRFLGAPKIHGALADLGVSSHHLDMPERGFSFRFEAELDMRMNQAASLTAKDVLNHYPQARLADVLFHGGEVRGARKIAQAIEAGRRAAPLRTTTDLARVVEQTVGKAVALKLMPQVFQAIRIEVNQELAALKDFLEQATQALVPGGRLAVITYHSLEDRLVKSFFRTGEFELTPEQEVLGAPTGPLVPVNRKVVVPDQDELDRNPRARSAKLRVAQKRDA